MRVALVPTALVLLLAVSGSARAQSGADIRFVIPDQAEVRSGPSARPDVYYVTNRLRLGQPVEVIGEEPGGWLKIRPPEGSFSWINSRFLEHIVPNQPNYVVALEGVEVPVFIGSSEIKDRRPWIRGVKLKRGTQVTSKGAALADEEGTWMPIEPPPGEVRYIRANVVKRNAPLPTPPTTTAAAGPTAGSTFTPSDGLVPSTAPSANLSPTPEVLFRRAEDAERANQIAEAIRLYALVGAEAAHSKPELSALALQRAGFLQRDHRSYGTGMGAGRPAAPFPPEAPTSSAAHLAPPPGSRPAEAVTTTMTIKREAPAPAASPANFTSLPPGHQARGGWHTFQGVLRRAGRSVDDRITYYLADERSTSGVPLVYVTPTAGVDLQAHLNRVVKISGPAVYRGELRNNYMTAVHVFPVAR